MIYPYPSVWINDREVLLYNILQGSEAPRSSFEENTFGFIRDWLTGKNDFYIQTSGSTGTPKQIQILRHQMIASAQLTAQALKLKKNDHALVCLDTKYIAGQMMLVRCFVTGMKIIATDPSSNPLSVIPEKMAVDFAALVPYQVYAMARADKDSRSLNTIRTILIGGSALDAETRQMLQSFQCRCFATYGMTETISHVALQLLNGEEQSPYFHTLPGVVIQRDERGCLVIEAPHLQEKIITNDLVELVRADTFRWLGRWDNMINSGGIKINPEKVEEQIGEIFRRSAIDRRFFVTGVADPQLGDKVILIVEGSSLSSEMNIFLYEQFREKLARHEIPKDIWRIDHFELTETGKINRKRTIQNINKSVENFTPKK